MKMRNLTSSILILLALMCSMSCFAQMAKPSPERSTVQFKIKNFGSTVNGTFGGLEGSIDFDPLYPDRARFDVSVDANSVDTNIGLRDKHLRNEEYFDVKTYPRLRFVSTSVASSTKSGEFMIKGNLTIKATTREITFPFVYSQVNGTSVFKGEFQVNRRDFNVGGNSFSLADTLIVMLSVAIDK